MFLSVNLKKRLTAINDCAILSDVNVARLHHLDPISDLDPFRIFICFDDACFERVFDNPYHIPKPITEIDVNFMYPYNLPPSNVSILSFSFFIKSSHPYYDEIRCICLRDFSPL